MFTDAQRAVIGKDLREVMASRQVWLPMLLVPVMMAVMLPAVFVGIAGFVPEIPPDMVATMRKVGAGH